MHGRHAPNVRMGDFFEKFGVATFVRVKTKGPVDTGQHKAVKLKTLICVLFPVSFFQVGFRCIWRCVEQIVIFAKDSMSRRDCNDRAVFTYVSLTMLCCYVESAQRRE
jgi:hypothetical protein